MLFLLINGISVLSSYLVVISKKENSLNCYYVHVLNIKMDCEDFPTQPIDWELCLNAR